MIFFRNLNLFLCAICAGFVLAVDINLDIKPTLKNQKIQKEIIKKYIGSIEPSIETIILDFKLLTFKIT